MILLRPIDPTGAYNRWDWIRGGLDKTIAKTDSHYRPEDVYLQIRSGQAWLYMVERDGEDVGFAVLKQEHDPDGLVLFVWALWCAPGTIAPRKQELYAALDQLATAIKAKRIRYWSPLRGWEREGFGKKVAVVFEREIGV